MTHITPERMDELWKQAFDSSEKGWKVSHRFAALLFAEAAAPTVQEPVAQDAEQWGRRLNDASWAVTKAWNSDLMGPMTGKIFNNIKGLIRTAILSYLEGYTTPPAALTVQPVAINEADIQKWQGENDVVMSIKAYKQLVKMVSCQPAEQPAPTVQEPVAWMHEWDDGERVPMLRKREVDSSDIDSPKSVRPLVFGDTTPPAAPKKGQP